MTQITVSISRQIFPLVLQYGSSGKSRGSNEELQPTGNPQKCIFFTEKIYSPRKRVFLSFAFLMMQN